MSAAVVEPVDELQQDLVEFAAWMQRRGLSAKTRADRVAQARAFYVAVNGWDVPGESIVGWLERYRGWTRNTYQVMLGCLFAWLTESGRVTVNPMPTIRRTPTPRGRPSPLSPAELADVLERAEGDERAWLLLGARAGLRAHEIAKVHGRDVSERRIRVLGKGGLAAEIPTHPELWELAQAYPRDGYWFPSPHRDRAHVTVSCVSNRIAALLRRVGLDGSIHRARHTFATELLRAGVNIRVVQELMRHASIETTARYLLVAEDELTAAVGVLGVSG